MTFTISASCLSSMPWLTVGGARQAIESATTAAMVRRNPEEARDLRKATVFSDAVLAVLRAPPVSVNGRLLLDEDFLRSDAGITDFAPYAVVSPLHSDSDASPRFPR